MQDKGPLFILAGNGPYENRGCEAIVRGTVEILRHHFDDPRFVVVSSFQSNFQFEQQKLNEMDGAIIHKKINRAWKRWEPIWFLQKRPGFLYPNLKGVRAVLAIGGDNYSLDYGIPKIYTDLDDLFLAKKKPLIIWGASVGPFSRIPRYEQYIIEHLKKITAVFARESATIEYLASRGIQKNVYRVADPAFLLEPVIPPREKFNIDIPKEAIGINLSPLMAKYVTGGGSLNEWINHAAQIIKHLSEQIKRPLFLIYHVTNADSDDYEFLRDVSVMVGKRKGEIELIPPGLNAAELKWVIGKMSVFAGARTHSTIAAISSCVPTLNFAYSMKAKGISRNIFGHESYCLDPHQLRPDTIAEKIGELLENSEEIKKRIGSVLPEVKNLALCAGKYLKEIVSEL